MGQVKYVQLHPGDGSRRGRQCLAHPLVPSVAAAGCTPQRWPPQPCPVSGKSGKSQ